MPKPKRCNEDHVVGEVALLTGGQDRSYVFGLTTALSRRGIHVHVVGDERVDNIEFHTSDRITFVDRRGMRPNSAFVAKLLQLAVYYARLVAYVTFDSPKILHILWNNKVEYFDRTLLTLYFKCLGKKIVLTAHNVNKAKRDCCDSVLNRLTLRIQYYLADQIFVHTDKMKSELVQTFDVSPDRVAVIPFGMNLAVPDTELTASQAKRRLGIGSDERAILFYGRIVPYKGLECLVEAFHCLAPRDANCRLIIAGEPMIGFERYVDNIRRAIADGGSAGRILCRLEFIPDDETEVYFKAADVLVLPYKNIFESGVLFLAYRFGLPVIASDVGSFREELTSSGAGLLFEPANSAALSDSLEAFFKGELFNDAIKHRQRIHEYAGARHSWGIVGEITEHVYSGLLKEGARLAAESSHVAGKASKSADHTLLQGTRSSAGES